MIKAIVARYGKVEGLDCETFQAAKRLLNGFEEDGEGFAVAIVETESKTAYFPFPDNLEGIGVSKEAIHNQRLDSLKELGIEPEKIEQYGRYPEEEDND